MLKIVIICINFYLETSVWKTTMDESLLYIMNQIIHYDPVLSILLLPILLPAS